MTFTKDSILVKTWVSLVVSGVFTADQVPALFNLRTVVVGIVNELAGEQERRVDHGRDQECKDRKNNRECR